MRYLAIFLLLFCSCSHSVTFDKEPRPSTDNLEVSATRYLLVDTWIETYPAMVPQVRRLMLDGVLTNAEYNVVIDLLAIERNRHDMNEFEELKTQFSDKLYGIEESQ